MKYFVVILLVAVAMCSALPNPIKKHDAEFQKFKQDFKKQYADEAEEARRYEIFSRNLEEILEHNKKYEAGEVKYTKGINQFTDLTTEEFLKNNTGLRQDLNIGNVE